MKIFLKFSLLFFASTLGTLGQNKQKLYFMDQLKIQSSDSRIEKNKDGIAILISEYRGENVKLQSRMDMTRTYLGTPYFGDQWFMGHMSFTVGKDVSGVMAYNMVNSTLYYSLNENVQAVEVKPNIFTLNGVTFQTLDSEFKGTAGHYYEILSNGEPKLLKQHIGKYIQLNATDGSTYGSNSQDDYEGSFEKIAKYYLVIQKELVLVSNKKRFYKSMGPYAKKGKTISDEKHLDMRKEEDILKLVSSLISAF
jgi:hypothetical protein